MRSKVDQGDKTKDLSSQYYNSFPFPRADSFGVCNNFKSVSFMINDQSSCTQIVLLQDACLNILNPDFYSTNLIVYNGFDSGNTFVPVKTSNVLTYES